MKINQDIFLILNTANKKRLAEFFLNHNLVISEREIGKLLNIPSMSTHRILQDFAAINFINISRIGKANAWKANKNSYVYLMFKRVFDFYKSVSSPIERLKEVLRAHLVLPSVKKIILYGSVAKGEEKSDSDIDVCVLVASQQVKDKIEIVVDQAAIKCLDLFGNRLEVNVLTEKEYEKLKNKELMNAIGQGIEVISDERKA